MFKKCIIISLANIMILLLLACGKKDTYTDINNIGTTISNDVNNKNNKYGYQIGKPIYVLGVVNSNIDDVSAFNNGRGFVLNSSAFKWAIISKDGKIISDYIIDSGPGYKPVFNDGLIKAGMHEKAGKYFDINGNLAVDFSCSWSTDFSDGYAIFFNEEHMYGFINTKGENVIPCIYGWADKFSEGLAAISKHGLRGYIDKEGNEVIQCVFEDAHGFSEKMAAIKQNGKWGYIDTKGKLIVDCKYDEASAFINGFAWVGIKDGDENYYIYIDKNGKQINSEKYYKCFNFYEGLAAVVDKNKKLGFINSNGEQIIPCQFDYLYGNPRFYSGYATLAKSSDDYVDVLGYKIPIYEYCVIDKNGNFVIDYTKNLISNFSENLASYQYHDKYAVSNISKNLSTVYNDGKYGIIDTNGDFVIPPVFDKVSDFSEGLALAKYNDKILILTYLNPYDLGYTQNQLLKTKNILLKNDTIGYFTSYYKQLEENNDSVIINTSNWKEKDYKNDLDKTLKKKEAKPNTWYVTDAGIWYYFEEDRTTKKTGWYKDPEDNQTYYLYPGTGIMATGWVEIDGDMYYFNEEHSNDPNWFYVADQDIWASAGKDVKSYGSMYKNETTPDGYYVDANGVKDGQEIAATNTSNTTLKGISDLKCVKDYSSNTTFDKMDAVTFGSYSQNGNNESVEWLLLDKQDNKALLISKYVLDCKPYNETPTSVNWDNCTLNKWLNNDFKNTIFTGDEKNEIINIIVPSINDMNSYFNDDEARKAIATKYAKDNGCWTSSQFIINGDGTACYFLSDNGDTMDKAAFVGDSGKIGSWGSRVNLDDCGIRPAIWVKIN